MKNTQTNEHRFLVNGSYRMLRFGGNGKGVNPREGFARYGAFRPGRFRRAEVTMCYPRGGVEAARRLFRLLAGAERLTGLELRCDERRWVEYEADAGAGDGLMRALYDSLPPADAAACRMFVLLVPSSSAGLPWRSDTLFTRWRKHLSFAGDCCLGPIPVHAPGSEAFARRLPALALRLLWQLEGMPWVPVHRAAVESELLIGLSCSDSLPITGRLFSAVFRTPAADGSYRCSHCEERRFTDSLESLFGLAYNDFLQAYGGAPLSRLVLCCPPGFPLEKLKDFRARLGRRLPDLQVVTAQVRLPVPGSSLPSRRASLTAEPPGTCLCHPDGDFSLYCREVSSRPGDSGPTVPLPFRVTPRLLLPSGGLSPLPSGETAALAGLLCRSAWADPLCLDGAFLPSPLLQAGRLLNRLLREWRQEREYRNAILMPVDALSF